MLVDEFDKIVPVFWCFVGKVEDDGTIFGCKFDVFFKIILFDSFLNDWIARVKAKNCNDKNKLKFCVYS